MMQILFFLEEGVRNALTLKLKADTGIVSRDE